MSWRPTVDKELTLQKVLGSRGSSNVCRLFMSNKNMHETTFQFETETAAYLLTPTNKQHS